MTRPISTAPFWPPAPRPLPLSDPDALAALGRIVDGRAPDLPCPGREHLPDDPAHCAVRAGGRIVGLVLPFPDDGDGPVYVPLRGPGRIRELVEEGIIA